jgi:hypothetical protein
LATTSAPQNFVLVSKKVLYGRVLIAVITVSIVTWFFLTRNNSSQTYQVQITEFSKETPIDQNNGYVYWPFTVSIQNKGSNYVRVFTLLVRMLGNDNTELGRTTEQFTTLASGERRTVTVGMYLPYGAEVGKTPLSYVASLKRFDSILDEVTLP